MNSGITWVLGVLTMLLSAGEVQEPGWKVLFDGSGLDQWDTYLGPGWDKEAGEFRGSASGLNADPNKVFTVTTLDGEKVLRVSGEVWGGISTRESFSNYHLRLAFRWGEKKWAPRDSSKRDSGLLYHCVGEHGAGSGFWLKSQEFQIQEGDCGDYWAVAGAIIDIPSVNVKDSIFRYSEEGELNSFGLPPANKVQQIYCKKNPDAEHATGEWNILDLYVFEDRSVHVVNGVVTMKLQHSRHLADGIEQPLTSGRIQLQSESAEIFFKNIRIRSIKQLPGHL